MRTIKFEPPTMGKHSGKMIRSRYTKDGSFPKRGRDLPSPRTVGELKTLLAQIPDKMPVKLTLEPVKVVWFNIGDANEHLGFEPYW
jgi:hypothetical protein